MRPVPRMNCQGPTARARDRAWMMYPLSIISDGMGLNVTVMSYRHSVDIGITADREQTPEVQEIVDHMHRELALLLKRIPGNVD